MGNKCCNPGDDPDFSYKKDNQKKRKEGRMPNISIGQVDTITDVSQRRNTLQKYDESSRTWMHEVNHAENRIEANNNRASAAVENEQGSIAGQDKKVKNKSLLINNTSTTGK